MSITNNLPKPGVIKFRGKAIGNGEWCFGYYANHADKRGSTIYGEKYGIAYKVDPATVGQFIGALGIDNPIEAYEGDFVLMQSGIRHHETYEFSHEGVLVRSYAGWALQTNEGGKWWLDMDAKFTLLGNVHTNPELLEKKVAEV